MVFPGCLGREVALSSLPPAPHRHAVTPSTQLSGTAPSPVLGAQVRSLAWRWTEHLSWWARSGPGPRNTGPVGHPR